ncbi:MAG: hypothetical protein ACK5HT_08610 [Draconibacterium sp.]
MKRRFIFFILGLFIFAFLSCEKNNELNQVDEPSNPLTTNVKLKSGTINYDWSFAYVDNFNNANVSNGYGLNDNLGNRQLHGPWKNTTWIRKEGTWYSKPIYTWFSQVNHPVTPNALSFHLEHSAVMLNRLIPSGSNGGYRVSFITNPVKNDESSGNWASFMLDGSGSNRGYVSQTEFGFLIRSNGSVSVFQNGNSKTVTGSVTPAAEYQVVLDISTNLLTATINGTVLTATLDEQVPANAYAYLGAYITPNSGDVSWFDNLVINTQNHTEESRIKHYGYYWASSAAFGEHLSEVEDYTNFNFIATVSASTPNTKTHVLQARWQFWADTSGNLRPEWLTRWNNLLADINQNIDKIKALYVVDEPFWAVNVSLSDYNMVLNQIKSDLPDLPIIVVFAYPTVEDLQDTRIANATDSLDWVGADKYVGVNDFSEVVSMNNILMNDRPDNDVFLIPQTHINQNQASTDAEVAEINWMFYNEALRNNRVIGLWNFGLWSHQKPAGVPITLEAQELIGNAIVNY